METFDNQSENSSEKPWLWKKGQSGNLKGRPKGKTLKEYCREFLAKMTDEERDAFLDGIPKEVIWKMSEGNPETKTENTHKGTFKIEISEKIANKHTLHDTPHESE